MGLGKIHGRLCPTCTAGNKHISLAFKQNLAMINHQPIPCFMSEGLNALLCTHGEEHTLPKRYSVPGWACSSCASSRKKGSLSSSRGRLPSSTHGLTSSSCCPSQGSSPSARSRP